MIKLTNIHIQFGKKHILQGNFQAKPGQLTGLVGESGSGKTSLLNILSLYYYNQDFDYFLNDTNLKYVSKEELSSFMKQHISFLPQHPLFLETMTCLENVQLECEIVGVKKTKSEILEVLGQLQLKDKANKYTKKLSGGEKQRLMIASAILKNASIILCDEITSSLDNTNTKTILDILKDLAHNQNKIVIVSSHEDVVISECDEVYEINDKTLMHTKQQNFPTGNVEVMKRLQTKKHYLYKIALSRLKKKKVVFTLLLIVASITVASLTYASTWLKQQEDFSIQYLERAISNEIFISSKWHDDFDNYDSYSMPIDETIVSQIKEIETIETIYPYTKLFTGMRKAHTCLVEWFVEEEKLGEYIIRANQDYVSIADSIAPYFEEQKLYEACDLTTSITDGVYLDNFFTEFIGITEIHEGMKIAFDVYVPVGYEKSYCPGQTIKGDGTVIDYVSECPFYFEAKKIRVTLPVSGILKLNHQSLGGNADIYVPQEVILNCIEEAHTSYELQDNQYPLQPVAYTLFLSSSEHREETMKTLRGISSEIVVNDAYEDHLAQREVVQDIMDFFSSTYIILYVVALIMLMIYSVFHKKDVLKDLLYLETRGLTTKDKKTITLIEATFIAMIIFIIASPMLIYLMNIGMGEYYVLGNQEITPINYSLVIFKLFVLSIISAIACNCTLLFSKEV